MNALYRKRLPLPSLALVLLSTLLLFACDGPPPPQNSTQATPNVYLEAVQEAEALKHSLEENNLEKQRLDSLLGRDTTPQR